ncbi:MAG: SurA N-terminal domain-containing protein [Acidimicrobiales bacterium]|nr:SurA N-terminal domain-containing protein [Acidimicrobiales bacterium]
MDRSRTSSRRRGLAVVGALAVAVVASSCSGGAVGRPAAATVDGVEISQAEVQDLVEANQAFYQQAIDNGLDTTGDLASALADTEGVAPGTVSQTGAGDALNSLIVTEVLHQELERMDALPDDALLQEVRTSLETDAGGAEELATYDDRFVEFTIRTEALQRAYRQVLADEANADVAQPTAEEREARILELYQTVKADRPLCLNVILVATEGEAADALARVQGGEAFADVAADVSIEPQSAAAGGFVGCTDYAAPADAFGADLEGAAVGDLQGPLPADTGTGETQYVVIEVAGTDGPTIDQVRGQLEAAVDSESAATDPTTVDITPKLLELLGDADITVDPRYGTWNPDTFDIDPPDAPEDPGTTTTTLPVLDPNALPAN